MLDGMLQSLNPSIDRDRFMDALSLEMALATLKQTNLIIGIQAPMLQPAPPHIVAARHRITIGACRDWEAQQGLHLRLQAIAYPLIGVKAEDPVAAGQRDRGILGLGIPIPGPTVHVGG